MRLTLHSLTLLLLAIVVHVSSANPPLPARPLTISKYIGTTRREEIMLNRIVPYAGAHIGGVHVDTRTDPPRFYFFDSANNRILGYNGWQPVTLPDGPFPEADIVIGQPAMWDAGTANTDNTRFLPPTAETLALLPFPYVSSTAEAPRSGMMATDEDSNFYVVDLNNNRVLKYIDPFTTDQIADDIWGQTTFTNRSPNNSHAPAPPSATTLRTQWNYGTTIGAFSAGVDIDAEGNLWVADSFNNRIIRFPKDSKTADLVLGQANFTTRNSGTSASQMYNPTGVRVHPDTGEVFVLDGQDDRSPGPRMMVFTPPLSNGMAAQRTFGAGTLSWARGFCIDPFHTNIIWVADGFNNRIVQFDHITGTALDCIGQPNLSTFMGIGKYVRPDGTIGDFKQPDGSISIDAQTNLYFTSFYGLNKVVKIPLPITRNAQGHVHSAGEMLKEGMNENSGRTFQDPFGMTRWNDQMFVRDRHRVLVWTNYNTATTFQSADLVIGQSALDVNEPGGTFEGRMLGMIHAAGDYLFVVSGWKLFIFDLPIQGGGRNYPPVKTIDGGQLNQLRWADDLSDARPVLFDGVAYDPLSNVLWVAHNHSQGNPGSRVLRINDPFASIPVIDMVIGQTNKTGGLKNKGKYIESHGPFTVDATDMANPSQVFLDNYRNLYVVDSGYEGRVDNGGNRRVVRFDAHKTVPVGGNIFPNTAADAVFCKTSLTATRNEVNLNRPGTPITVSFSEDNVMALTDDTYNGDTEQGMRVFLYPTPHIGETPQPTEIVDTYLGQPAFSFWDGDMFVLQDHTWNRIYFHLPSATAPYLSITNAPYTTTDASATIAGVASNIVGQIWWFTEDGLSGTVPAADSWSIADISLVYGPTLITVNATNAAGHIASDTLTITRDFLDGDGLPHVQITTPPAHVPNSTATYTIQGTANRHAVGALAWHTDKGAQGHIPATDNWEIEDIPLAGGANLITVTATNYHDEVATASVTITREPGPGEGTPHVTITTSSHSVEENVTSVAVAGTNNTHVVGMMWWQNSRGGNGAFTAEPTWLIPAVPLALGDNYITVYGSNVYGDVASDSVRIAREATITNTTWQSLAVTNGLGYARVGSGLRMDQRSTLVKNFDDDGYIYLQAHASEGNPRYQSIWRIRSSTHQDNAPGAWELVIGGIPVNSAGGETGQKWIKYNDVFYSAMWAQFGEPSGGPWYWSWYGFYTTNATGNISIPGVNPEYPVVVRATGDAYPDAARNLAGILSWEAVDSLVALCTNRDGDTGPDAQIREWDGFGSLTTLHQQETDGINSAYSVGILDSHAQGHALILNPDGDAVWSATNLFNSYAALNTLTPRFPLPLPLPSDAITDLQVMSHPVFRPYTVFAASVWTTQGRKIYLYNIDRPDLPPMDITPPSGLHQFRNTLAADGAYIFMSYDAGSEAPGLMRLSLLAYDLTPLDIPEPTGIVALLLSLVAFRFRHRFSR